jgi:hypothetical protein
VVSPMVFMGHPPSLVEVDGGGVLTFIFVLLLRWKKDVHPPPGADDGDAFGFTLSSCLTGHREVLFILESDMATIELCCNNVVIIIVFVNVQYVAVWW